ncbi:GNAT family N-acetyltransferase [Oerskovia flava]|uniref:GNAT family N-acetyltransferase n=1 Tax=Oerskovia flava TaxID=2986422 RepID=UPI00223EE5EE|nr:GNAT family N-acetyltransferase [Oerskovia sp. JB1-3-2]
MSPRLLVSRATDAATLAEAFALRIAVFVDEQGVPLDEEVDELDRAPTTAHVVVRRAEHGEVVGTGRLLTDAAHPGEVHVGRVAVAPSARGHGVGALVMQALEEIALADHASSGTTGRAEVRVLLSAQTQASGFYERLGYELHGPVYLDAGIDHRDAVKVLRRPQDLG